MTATQYPNLSEADMEEIRLSLPIIPSPSKKLSLSLPKKQLSLPVLKRIPTSVRGPPLLINKLSSAQRLRREKTFTSAKTEIGKALQQMDEEHVHVEEHEVENVLEQVKTFLYTISHRINKNRHNLKFGEPYLTGPAINGLTTKYNYNELTVYFPLKFKDFRMKGSYQGYTCIHTNRNPSFDRFQTIRSEGHRNLISPMKISQALHELMTHLCQSVGRGSTLPFHSNNSVHGEGTHQIVILLEDGIRLTVIPSLHPKPLKRDEDGTIYITKPYHYDQDPESDTLWRYDNPSRVSRLLTAMNSADRGVRSKALRLIHISANMDPILQTFPQEFITLILYNMFDEDVDDLPCWQTVDLERCFANILTSWHTHMTTGRLLHPFTPGLNMMTRMSEPNRIQLKNRLTRLLCNRRELLRLVTPEATKQTKETSQSSLF